MTRMEALEEYVHAQKRAQRDYREKMAAGQYPYLPVLDDILENARVENQLPIGTVEIPLALVVGTKTAGRTATRDLVFLPLLSPKTELPTSGFRSVRPMWTKASATPIRCFEYLGRFYVQEGNKAVSNTRSSVRGFDHGQCHPRYAPIQRQPPRQALL